MEVRAKYVNNKNSRVRNTICIRIRNTCRICAQNQFCHLTRNIFIHRVNGNLEEPTRQHNKNNNNKRFKEYRNSLESCLLLIRQIDSFAHWPHRN